MADRNECRICKQMTKEKYKHYNLWRVLAIVFICISVVLGILYFATGNIVIDEEYVVEQENTNSGNNNTQSNVIELKDNSIMIGLIIGGIAIGGGVIVGCSICKKKNNN